MSDLKQIASTLHLLLCTKHHVPKDGESSDTDCCWYLEDQISNCWDEPDHKDYLVDAEIFIELLGNEDEDKPFKALKLFMDVCSRVSFASNAYPEVIITFAKMITKAI